MADSSLGETVSDTSAKLDTKLEETNKLLKKIHKTLENIEELLKKAP